MENIKTSVDKANNTLTMEYTIDAPKEAAWQAYTTKDQFEKWWGPEGWETTTKEFEFKPGGRIHYGMKCVDQNQAEFFGQESWGVTNIEEINDQDWYRARDHFSDADGSTNDELPTMVMENHFAEKDGKTTITSKVITETPEQLEQLISMGMVDGFSSQLNKLEDLLASNG